jgi:1-phosphatidylinositol-4-phosphate 5-kinase
MASLTEQSTAGKSGSFFYYSEDGKFMLKTISRREHLFLKSILKPYFYHLAKNPHSLIIKIYGLYNMVFTKGKNQKHIYFIVMGNLFHTPLDIDVKYDLKGKELIFFE